MQEVTMLDQGTREPDAGSVETTAPKERWKYEDPSKKPDRKGLLLSDEVGWFCNHQLLIDKNYCKKQLRPAAYTLRIGTEYVDSRGRRGRLTEKKPSFYIEPNSIAYVSTFESLDLPYYIAARFNLRVKWVYRGILLGTGPQVEPGYKGFLSCPLFNLTDRAIKVTLKDEFATIDFERTTGFCPDKSWEWLRENIIPSREIEKLDEVSVGTRKLFLFKQRPYPALEHLPDWDVVSSLVQLSNEVKTWRYIGIGIVVAFFGLALSLLSFQNNLYREVRTQDSRLSVASQAQIGVDSELNRLNAELAEARNTVLTLESRIEALERRPAGDSARTSPAP
jgi:deoxycytidine triphosphate deaminase